MENSALDSLVRRLGLMVVPLLTVCFAAACGSDSDDSGKPETDGEKIDRILGENNLSNPYDSHLDSMPGQGCRKLKINLIGGPLAKVFNDSNHVHLGSARLHGIDPINSHRDAWRVKRPMVKLESNRYYYVDELTHSMPYLVPEAEKLLSDIGRRFREKLESRGGGDYRIKVTSVLRTPKSVSKLRRRNKNAVEESTHLYGTTFDISYAKFICDSETNPRTQEDLKNLLGEVLYELREQGRCWVKFERKQACFHITVR